MADSDYLAAALVAALQTAGLTVVGVSIGSRTDKATWTVQLPPGASAPDVALAAATVAAFDLAGLPARVVDAQATSDVDQKVLRACLQALWEAIPAPTLTKVQLRARAIAIWKTLP